MDDWAFQRMLKKWKKSFSREIKPLLDAKQYGQSRGEYRRTKDRIAEFRRIKQDRREECRWRQLNHL